MLKNLANKLKGKKEKYPTLVVPRTVDEINAEYSKLAGEAGGHQYDVFVKERELQRLNLRILELDIEMRARTKLDKDAAEAVKAALPPAGKVEAV